MDESIKIALKDKKNGIDLNPLITIMEDSGIEFKNCKLNGPFGMATHLHVYLDLNKIIESFNPSMIWYIVLHEIGHYRRIQKMGKDKMLEMFSLDDFEAFYWHVITEEIFADRYASFIYYKNNKKEFPRNATQQLHLKGNQIKYKGSIEPLFGVVKNNEKNYIELVESYIIKD